MNLSEHPRRRAAAKSATLGPASRRRSLDGGADPLSTVAVAAVRRHGAVAATARRRAGRGADLLLRGLPTRSAASLPRETVAGAAPRRTELPVRPDDPQTCARTAARHAKASRSPKWSARSSTRSSIPSRLINGEEFVSLLWSRFNPTQADRGLYDHRGRPRSSAARQRGRRAGGTARPRSRLRGVIAQSPLDFDRSHHHVEIDHDVEQTMWVATTAEHTQMGWLMGAMMSRQPFTLSVHVRALDRRRERTKLKMRYRRVFAVNRGAESTGKGPGLRPLRRRSRSPRTCCATWPAATRTNLFDVSIYLTAARAARTRTSRRSVRPSISARRRCRSTSDAAVNRGAHHQRRLWPSTLPLGRDLAGYSRGLRDAERRRLRAAGGHELRQPGGRAVCVCSPRPHA